jgi:hypothetical protein
MTSIFFSGVLSRRFKPRSQSSARSFPSGDVGPLTGRGITIVPPVVRKKSYKPIIITWRLTATPIPKEISAGMSMPYCLSQIDDRFCRVPLPCLARALH